MPRVRNAEAVPVVLGAPHPPDSAPFHQINKNDGMGWSWAIHCRLLPPHNHIYSLDHHIVKKKMAEKLVFDGGKNPQIGIDVVPGPNLHQPLVGAQTLQPQLLYMPALRKKIIEWFQHHKTLFINPHTNALFHDNSKIIHSSDQQLMGAQVDNLYTFGGPQGQPNAILGGKRKKKKRTKKKNRKNKNKISKKKR